MLHGCWMSMRVCFYLCAMKRRKGEGKHPSNERRLLPDGSRFFLQSKVCDAIFGCLFSSSYSLNLFIVQLDADVISAHSYSCRADLTIAVATSSTVVFVFHHKRWQNCRRSGLSCNWRVCLSGQFAVSSGWTKRLLSSRLQDYVWRVALSTVVYTSCNDLSGRCWETDM